MINARRTLAPAALEPAARWAGFVPGEVCALPEPRELGLAADDALTGMISAGYIIDVAPSSMACGGDNRTRITDMPVTVVSTGPR